MSETAPILSAERQPEDIDAALRPKTLADFVGQHAEQQQGANGDQGGRDFHAHTLRERDQASLIRRNPALFDCPHDNRYVFMRRNRDFVYAPLGNPAHFVR